MKPYLLSAAAGLLVGIVYAVINVRSPAPPVIALVGLLGILVGEQLPSLARNFLHKSPEPQKVSWIQHQVRPHMFGELPRSAARTKPPQALAATSQPKPEERQDV